MKSMHRIILENCHPHRIITLAELEHSPSEPLIRDPETSLYRHVLLGNRSVEIASVDAETQTER